MTFSQVGSIPITDKATLQIGAILFAIRQLWPSGSSQVITGSICSCNSKKRLFARYEEANHASKIHAYTVTQEEVEEVEQEQKKKNWHEKFWHEKSYDPVPKMVQSLASRIAVDSSSTNFSTSDWVAFQSFTEALFHFYCYEKTASKKEVLAELKTAFFLCQIAIEKDKEYKIVSDLLSEISVSYLNHDEFDNAGDALALAMKINPNNSYVHSTYGKYYYFSGDNQKAKKSYEYAKELNPNDPMIYLRLGAVHLVDTSDYSNETRKKILDFDEARKNFWSALDLDPSNNSAKSFLAWLDFLCYLEDYLEELKKEPETTKEHYIYFRVVFCLKNLPEKRIPCKLSFAHKIYIWNTENFPTMKLSLFPLNLNCYKQASRKLHNAVRRLKQIPQDKKNYIDYSNLAIFLLYKNPEKYEKQIQLNWWKAKQLCSGNNLDSDQPVNDKLHYMFYNFLTLESNQETIDSITEKLKALLEQIEGERKLHQRVIDNLLIDAKIILVKCIQDKKLDLADYKLFKLFIFDTKYTDDSHPNLQKDLLNSCSERKSEFTSKIGRAMQEFIKILFKYLNNEVEKTPTGQTKIHQ